MSFPCAFSSSNDVPVLLLNQSNIVSYMPTDEMSVISYTFTFESAFTVNSIVCNFFQDIVYLPDVLSCINKSDDDDDDDILTV